eukprot:302060_1
MQELLNKALSDFETNQEEYQITESKITESSYQCICGHNLIETKYETSLYNSNRCYCDIGARIALVNDTLWHCERKDDIHRGGFDICSNCIGSYNPQISKKLVHFEETLQRTYIENRNSIMISDCTFMVQLLNEMLKHPNCSRYHRISLNILSINLNNLYHDFHLKCLYKAGFKTSVDDKYLKYELCENNKTIIELVSLSLIMVLILLFDEPLPKMDNSYLLNTEVNKLYTPNISPYKLHQIFHHILHQILHQMFHHINCIKY